MRETGLADNNVWRPIFIDRISFKELELYVKKCEGRVILPIGSIEPHDEIFPLGTDKIIAERLSLELAEEFYKHGKCVVIAPTISYGISVEWKKSNSTITLSSHTMYLLLKDILNSLKEMGFSKIILLNAHGGNSEIIRLVSREFISSNSDVKIIVLDWWRIVSDIISEVSSANTFLHSDEIELSMLLYWGIVNKNIIDSDIPKASKLPWQEKNGVEIYTCITREQSLTAYGDPGKASISIGKRLVEEFCKRVLEVLE